MQRLWWAFLNIAGLVNLTPLNRRVVTEVSANGLRQGLRSINDEQPRHRRIKPALDKILDQGLNGRGTLRRAFGKAERMLVPLRIDADRCHEGHILVHMNAADF